MHDNFENLQKRCKRYRLKKRVKFIVPAISVILIIGISLYLSETDENSFSIEKVPFEAVESTKTKEIKKVETTVKTKIKEQIVEEKIIEDIPYALQIDKKYLTKKQTHYVAKPTYKEEVVPQQLQRVYIKIDEPKPLAISVKKLDSVKDMIAYYNKENKYSLALKIAQTYYDAKNYSQSLLWSKKANLLNRDADGAWILYAKSEYAVGNHERAIKILNLYITNADSDEAKTLLLNWTQGK